MTQVIQITRNNIKKDAISIGGGIFFSISDPDFTRFFSKENFRSSSKDEKIVKYDLYMKSYSYTGIF